MHESQQQPSDGTSRAGMSRRSVLAGAGAGAAGLALSGLAAAPALAARRTSAPAAAGTHQEAVDGGEAFVVHIRDIGRGEMDVYRGTSHVRVTDRSVAAALARASSS
ncbi:MAG TPA: hypothetical protein VK823_04335 [Streptosporangiaceae bacterium]|jgi:hypothetical protein|nr:hypothetical protein [Streptosporangiaceae bacterium]